MARKLAVEIVGSATSLKAALGSASAAVTKFAGDYKAAFAGMTTSALQLAVAEDRLAVSTARFGVGSQGAARATLAYRRELDALSRSSATAFQNMGRTLTTFVTLPVALLGYESTKMAVTFNRNMTMVQTQAGASAQEMQKMTKAVLELAKVSPQGPIELAQGLYHLESLGLRGAKAMEALRLSSIAAGMGIADIEDVATALGGAVVTNIQGTQNYTEAMGTLNATIGVGNMRMGEMAAALGTGLLPAALNAGLSLDQVGAALAVLTDRGISAENAGTRLRMTFALMQAPSRKAQEALSDMGVDAEYMSKTLRGPNGLYNVLRMLHDAMKRVGAVRGSSDILRAFGGGRSGAGILTLIQSLDSSISSYQGKLAQIQRDQSKFGENMKVYMETPSYKLSIALHNLQANMTKLGQSLTPVIVGLGKTLGVIANGFSALPAPIKRDLGVIVGLLAVGGPLFLAIAGVTRMIKAIGTAFEAMAAKATISTTVVDGEMVAMGATAEATAGKVGMIRTALMGISKIAAILIPINVAINVTGDWDKFKTLVLSGRLGSAALFALTGSTFGTEKIGYTPPTGPDTTAQDAATFNATFGLGALLPAGGANAPTNKGGMQGVGGTAPGPKKLPIKQVPMTVLPRSFTNLINWALLTDTLKDDLKVAQQVEAFWRKQLDLAAKMYGKKSEAYAMILQSLAQAHQGVQSLESQIETQSKKTESAADKAAKARAKIPTRLQSELYAARAAQDHKRELAALIKIRDYLVNEIKVEKNVKAKMLERKELAGIVKQITAARKSAGEDIIDNLQAAADAAQNISPSAYIRALLVLKHAIENQIKVQKDNTDLMKKLSTVNDQLAQATKGMKDSLKDVMGELGAGPVFGGGDKTLRLFALGIRHTADQYIRDLKAQISAFKLLQTNLNQLIARGAPTALIDELRGQGMAAFPEIFTLAHADKGTLKKFFEAFHERQNVIQQTATAEIKATDVNLIADHVTISGHPPAIKGAASAPSASFDLRPPSGITVHKAEGGPVQGRGMGDSVHALLTPGEWILNALQQRKLSGMMGMAPSHIAQKLFAGGGMVGSVMHDVNREDLPGYDLGGIVGAAKGTAHWLGVRTNFMGMGEKEAEEYAKKHPMLMQKRGAFLASIGQLVDPFYQFYKHPGLGTAVGAAGMLPIGKVRTFRSEEEEMWREVRGETHGSQHRSGTIGSRGLYKEISREIRALQTLQGGQHGQAEGWTHQALGYADAAVQEATDLGNRLIIATDTVGRLKGAGSFSLDLHGDWSGQPGITGGHFGAAQGYGMLLFKELINEAYSEGVHTHGKPLPIETYTSAQGAQLYTKLVNHGVMGRLHLNASQVQILHDDILGLARLRKRPTLPTKKDLIESYQNDSMINRDIRSGVGLSRTQKGMFAALQMSMRPLGKDMTLWRGLSGRSLGINSLPEVPSILGKTFTDKAFMSTSMDEYTASEFATIALDNTGLGLLLKLKTPKGVKAFKAPSWEMEQHEVILAPGTKFKITSAGKPEKDPWGGEDYLQPLDGVVIPGMAKGGVVSRPTVALIGESGPEAVVPLNKGGLGDIYINTVHVHGVQNVDELREELRKLSRSSSPQGRGRMRQSVTLR